MHTSTKKFAGNHNPPTSRPARFMTSLQPIQSPAGWLWAGSSGHSANSETLFAAATAPGACRAVESHPFRLRQASSSGHSQKSTTELGHGA